MQLHILLSFLFAIGPSIGALESSSQDANKAAPWQPPVGAKFQIILNRNRQGLRRAKALLPEDADIFDLDLFDTTADTIRSLQAKGKKVICYFSAGSSESWRTDFRLLRDQDKGAELTGWANERWLDIRSPEVFDIMKARLRLAADKKCNAVDPDNLDGFLHQSSRGGGFQTPLTKQDAIQYLKKLAAEAHQYGLAIGLKNAEALLPSVQNDIEFAVNEECATYGGCRTYESFINKGKAVFHIEYATATLNGTDLELKSENPQYHTMTTADLEAFYCLEKGPQGNRRWMSQDMIKKFSSVIKDMDLSSWVLYCDRTWTGEGIRQTPKKSAKSTANPAVQPTPARAKASSRRHY